MDELKERLKKLEESLENVLEKARDLENSGEMLPNSFWEHIDSASDEINQSKYSLIRK